MAPRKRVRIIKKVREASGVWRFISLDRVGERYLWDKREGCYFLEWWEGKRRKRESAGTTPAQALEARRRKQNELLGELVSRGHEVDQAEPQPATSIGQATATFLEHVRVHSPSKPRTARRYQQVMGHFERVLGNKRYVEAITRADIDDYKIKRSKEFSVQHKRQITPGTVNFEVGTLRTFFNYLINERGLAIDNPCARFKPLRDKKRKAKRRPPTYTQDELDRLFAACREFDKAVFATLLLTGLRKEELYFLTPEDVDFKRATVRVTGEGKGEFSPKDYEERILPIPPGLVPILKQVPQRPPWFFSTDKGTQLNHLLRRLKEVARMVGIPDATLHKFRHTYATRLLESGCDIVTLQHLLGHSDLDTTRQYLNPGEDLKRKAVNKLSLSPALQPSG